MKGFNVPYLAYVGGIFSLKFMFDLSCNDVLIPCHVYEDGKQIFNENCLRFPSASWFYSNIFK